MSESPLLAAAHALGQIGLDQLAQYCRDHPSKHDVCRWCHRPIVSTPWFSPSGTFHMVTGSWTHELTETSPCGREHPYRFAEPEEEGTHGSTPTFSAY